MASLDIPAHGKNGTISFNSTAVDGIVGWVLTQSTDMIEVTNIDNTSAGYKEHIGGWSDWEVTVDLNNATSYLSSIGTTATLVLTAGDGTNSNIYTGTSNAILIGVAPSLDINDIVKQTLTFQGSGTLALSAGA